MEQYFVDKTDSVNSDTCTKTAIPKITYSNVAVITTDDSATITWTTDYPMTSSIIYGTTIDHGNTKEFDNSIATNHSMTVIGLSSGLWYYKLRGYSYEFSAYIYDDIWRSFTIESQPADSTATTTATSTTIKNFWNFLWKGFKGLLR